MSDRPRIQDLILPIKILKFAGLRMMSIYDYQSRIKRTDGGGDAKLRKIQNEDLWPKKDRQKPR